MRRSLLTIALLAGALAVAAGPAAAELVDRTPAGFTTRTVANCAASPDRVWAALCDIGKWWDPAHSFSHDADNLFLDPAGRRIFGENLPSGGLVTHMAVVYADPGRLLRMRGSLGPMQGMAVVGVLSVELAAAGEGTVVTATYVVGGYTAGGLDALAEPVDRVIGAQFGRLADYVSR